MKSSIAAVPLLLGLLAVAGIEPSQSPILKLSAAERAAFEATTITWPSLDLNSEIPHTVFGAPTYRKPDNQHQVTRNYHGFTVFYDDQVLAPRWTAIKLTSAMADANSKFQRLGNFRTDDAIKASGLLTTNHGDYNNPAGSKLWARGHMVQFDDARGWGDAAGEDSFLTSNITPQLQEHNSRGWFALEEAVTELARDYGVVWVYTGPIYDSSPKPFAAGRKVPKPRAFFKIVVSPSENNSVDVLAFLVPHKPIPQSADLSQFLVSVDQVEKETGLDFLRDLPDPIEDLLERMVWEMWPDV